MPWNVSGMVERRKGFLGELESGDYTMKECCERHGISRQVEYKPIFLFMRKSNRPRLCRCALNYRVEDRCFLAQVQKATWPALVD
jgi:hypothetical protein